jgi:hypothetical protein
VAVVVAGVAFAADVPRAEKGRLLLQENFQRYAEYTKASQPVSEGWSVRVAHGIWRRTDEGVQSTWESGHSPVLIFEGTFGDAIIEVDFRYTPEPGRWAACRVSAANPQLDPRAYATSVWANVDFKSRGRGFVLENDVWGGYITRLGYAKAWFYPDNWYTLTMQLTGNEVVATCNGRTAKGSHETFGIPKSSLWIGTGESSHELLRLRIREVVAARG